MLRRPDVHELIEVERVGAGVRVGSRNGEQETAAVKRLRNAVLDDALGRVRNLEHVAIANEVGGAVERGEGERGRDVRAFEELRVVANLAELHDEVHEALDAVVVVERGGARDEVGDGDVLAKGAVHDLLARGEVAVDVDLDLQATRSASTKGKNENAPCRRARSGRSS